MKTLAMFCGQGSQYVGMAKELLKEFPESKLTFEEAEDTSKTNIRKLCDEGPAEDLSLTENQQPCILTVSVAKWRILEKEVDLSHIYHFAGHSLPLYENI